MDSILQCQNLTKQYGSTCGLKDLTLTIPRGRIIGLLGPNGSGKTTFIKLCTGLLVPTSGTLTIGDHPIGTETKKIVSYLPERTYINNWMRVKEMLEFFSDFYKDFNIDKARDMLQNLHIGLDDKLKNMSKGTKEKVQLILVMSREADLYLLDEPIGGVDPAARDYIIKTILTNYQETASIILSTHLISEIESILDEAILIRQGSLILHDSVDEIREKKGISLDALFREEFKC
jgi:ABC-2 type transport system ATP-binding protein